MCCGGEEVYGHSEIMVDRTETINTAECKT